MHVHVQLCHEQAQAIFEHPNSEAALRTQIKCWSRRQQTRPSAVSVMTDGMIEQLFSCLLPRSCLTWSRSVSAVISPLRRLPSGLTLYKLFSPAPLGHDLQRLFSNLTKVRRIRVTATVHSRTMSIPCSCTVDDRVDSATAIAPRRAFTSYRLPFCRSPNTTGLPIRNSPRRRTLHALSWPRASSTTTPWRTRPRPWRCQQSQPRTAPCWCSSTSPRRGASSSSSRSRHGQLRKPELWGLLEEMSLTDQSFSATVLVAAAQADNQCTVDIVGHVSPHKQNAVASAEHVGQFCQIVA